MNKIRQTLNLEFSYDVHFTDSLLEVNNGLLADTLGQKHRARVSFVLDAGVARAFPQIEQQIDRYCRAHSDKLQLVHSVLLIEGGEDCKNDPANLSRIYAAINNAHLCRHSWIVAIGGGAILDLVGYAAATAHRGIRLARVPTTVLSQDDSGIGVKNSINAFGKKNFLGTFVAPQAVFIDTNFLTGLDYRDWRAGISEAVKVALIKDLSFFRFLEENQQKLRARNLEVMKRLVRRSAEIHLEHIANSGDPFEQGNSRPLDFGHWAGHKLEQLTRFQLRHGEAVAIGIALDATYSFLSGLLHKSDWERVIKLLAGVGFDLYTPELSRLTSRIDSNSLLSGLTEFREHLGGELTIMLLNGIGSGVEVHEMDDNVVRQSVALLEKTASTATIDCLAQTSIHLADRIN
jgi:3-dehydroquinate synthase